MESETFLRFEWRIENFSCWRVDTHGRCIKSEKYRDCQLYPKGHSGLDERIMVHIQDYSGFKSAGEFYFIGPDGSLICKQEVNPNILEHVLKINNGPVFGDVIAIIRQYEAQYGDSLTLQFRMKGTGDDHRIKTIIEVINLPTIRVGIDELKSDGRISYTTYSHDVDESLYLNTLKYVEDDENAKIPFGIQQLGKHLILVRTRLCLMSSDDSLIRHEENEHMLEKDWKFSDSLTRREMKEKGVVFLHFHVQIITPNISESHFSMYLHSGVKAMPNNSSKCLDPVKPTNNNNTVDVLSKELMCLYQFQDFSDFQLKCGDLSLPVHKNILSARSPVFKTMLSTDMQEAESGFLDVVDFDPSTLARFLTFLYTGAVGHLQVDSAFKLYYAADKYQVSSLQKECGSYLSANLCVANVCDVLALASKHHDEELAAVTREFVLKNFGDVLKSAEWKGLMKVEPLLVAETLTRLAERNLAVS